MGHPSIKRLVRSDLTSAVLALKLDELGGCLVSSRRVAVLQLEIAFAMDDTHLTYPRHPPAANQSCYSKTNRFSRILKQEPLRHIQLCAFMVMWQIELRGSLRKYCRPTCGCQAYCLTGSLSSKVIQVVHLNGFDM